MKNNNPDQKPELVDLLVVLNRRKVSVAEWLEYHDLRSKKDFNELGVEFAKAQGCFISEEMKQIALSLIKKMAQVEFQRLAESLPSLPTGLLAGSPEKAIEITRKEETKKKKKNSSNEKQDSVLLEEEKEPTQNSELANKE